MNCPSEEAKAQKEESQGNLNEKGKYSGNLKNFPSGQSRVTKLPDTKSRTERCVLRIRDCGIFTEPLLDEDAKGRSHQTDNETCEP